MVAAAILLVCGISVAGAVKLRFAGSGGSAADGTAGMTAQDDGRTAGSLAVSSADGSTPEKDGCRTHAEGGRGRAVCGGG